eukprot:5893247-Ditylum_brightwellii.AAC.1
MSVALVAFLSVSCGLFTLPFIHEAYPPVVVILIPGNLSTIMLVKVALLAIAPSSSVLVSTTVFFSLEVARKKN